MVIHRLMVSPDSQGQGLGRRMLRFAERHAYDAGFAAIRLDVYTGNPRARGLYARHGYQPVGLVRFPRRRLPFECFEKILPGTFQAGGVELLPSIQPLWEALRTHHLALAPNLAAHLAAKTFASRSAEFREKSVTGQLRVDLFKRQPSGALAGYAVTSFCAADQSSELDSLYVDPSLRGQGVGSLLVRRAMTWLHGCGARKPVVSVLAQNEEALRFYHQLGFQPRSMNLLPMEPSVWEEES
jgi:ribosomal protein S18 acetylase RimI-like enzyme